MVLKQSPHKAHKGDADLLPPLLESHQELTVWVLGKVRKFPQDLRFSFGSHVAENCLTIMDKLIEALYSGKTGAREQALKQVAFGIEQLRIQLRMAYQLKLINASALNFAVGNLKRQGAMLGGWIRTTATERLAN